MRTNQHSGELILRRAVSWTKSDTIKLYGAAAKGLGVDFAVVGVSVNADGNLAIRSENPTTGLLDAAVTIAVKAGIIYPMAPSIIMSTNTTATGIVVYG